MKRLPFLLLGVFLLGLAAGRGLGLGQIVVTWVAVLAGIGLSIPAVWQSITAARALRLQQLQHARTEADREADRVRTSHNLQAIAEQTYQRAAPILREMPAGPAGSWYDWGKLFAVTAGHEIRGLFLELRRVAADADPASATIGARLHSDFLELEQTVRLITTPNRDPRSPSDLAREAARLRAELRQHLAALGAKVGPPGAF